MMNKQIVTVHVNGKLYEVEVQDLDSSPMIVQVNGESYSVTYEVTSDTTGQLAVPDMVSAQPVIAEPSRPAASAPPSASGKDVRAPMPGVIVEVNVKTGEKVKAGQQLCALDAMKMKNAIRSPRDGIIASVEVNEGQNVSHNAVLIVFE